MIQKLHTYQESLDFLYSFVDYSLTRQLRYSPEKFDLERMRVFMDLLGNPHLKYPTIHVTGTKGKGSICAMVASILKDSGLRVGLYTSPHLQEYTERINIKNQDISKDDFVKVLDSLVPFINKVRNLSTFEITTALAFQFFYQRRVDVAVIEVGLGGRLDATNVVKPIVSIISSISKDHTKILGNTLKKIAYEKAGIIKEGVPVVVSKQKKHVKEFINEIALSKKSPFFYVPDQLRFKFIKQDLKGQEFVIKNNSGSIHIHLPLLGMHQIQNALTAYQAVQIISKDKFEINDQNIQNGFKKVIWPGRFEILSENPLFVIDSAHNKDSMNKLVSTTKSIFPTRNIIAIFGASEDKDINGMLKVLAPHCKHLITTQSTHPRAMDSDKILEVAKKDGFNVISIASIEPALLKALDLYDENSVILVTGSIFIAAAAREIWMSKNIKKRK